MLLPLAEMICIMPAKNLLLFLYCFSCFGAMAQLTPLEPDKSPMDMSYSPNNYPILKFQDKAMKAAPNARVIYSRPQKNGRAIFGDVVKYNQVWRMGANECTELDLYKDATIGGKKVLKGRYALYCIPKAGSWTIILNKGLDSWGAFSYKAADDVLRTEVKAENIDVAVEYFTILFDTNNALTILWDDTKVSLPIKFSSK